MGGVVNTDILHSRGKDSEQVKTQVVNCSRSWRSIQLLEVELMEVKNAVTVALATDP